MPLATNERSIFEYALAHLETEKARLDGLIADVQRQLGPAPGIASPVEIEAEPATAPRKVRKKRMMSPEARALIAAAQKKRWEAYHKAQKKTAKKKSPAKATKTDNSDIPF